MIEGFETRFYLVFLRYLKKHSFCSECTHMVNKAYSLLVDDGACPAALESIEDVTECSGGGGDNHCHANNPLPLPPNQVRPLIIYFCLPNLLDGNYRNLESKQKLDMAWPS